MSAIFVNARWISYLKDSNFSSLVKKQKNSNNGWARDTVDLSLVTLMDSFVYLYIAKYYFTILENRIMLNVSWFPGSMVLGFFYTLWDLSSNPPGLEDPWRGSIAYSWSLPKGRGMWLFYMCLPCIILPVVKWAVE